MNLKTKRVIKGEKITYKDGVGCTIWEQTSDNEDSGGPCFDFGEDQINELLSVIEKLKTKKAKPYIEEQKNEDLKWEAYEKKCEERDKKWYARILHFAEYLGLQFTPFRWNLGRSKLHHLVWIRRGLALGPINITW